MKVLKFGGSSVADAECIKRVIDVVYQTFEGVPNIAVVVSAFHGVTDTLIKLGKKALKDDESYLKDLDALRERHITIAKGVVKETSYATVEEFINTSFKSLSDTLRGVSLVEEMSLKTLDLIMSYGERLSAFIIAHALQDKIPTAYYVDARKLIVTDRSFGSALVDEKLSYENIRKALSGDKTLPVITGFIGMTPENETSTIGRGGSDLTAAIVGAALDAKVIEIWTDVDGVMTADPRKVPKAFALPVMSYEELMEMSHFGAKVVHPPTVAPAMRKQIPLWIKNTFSPKAHGTEVKISVENHSKNIIRGITSIDSITLLRLEGPGMVGVCGVASRLFGALAKENINVIIITQGSSEHSICFAIKPESQNNAVSAVDKEFSLERHAGLINHVVITEDVAVIAAVGENMHATTGMSGRFFSALGRNGINIIAIAQGSSEYNITCLVKRHDEKKALNVIHDEFFLSTTRTVNLFMVGKGLIGKALINQIKFQHHHLAEEYGINLRLCGIANSSVMAFNSEGIPWSDTDAVIEQAVQPMEVAKYISSMIKMNLGNSIFVDCTASESIAERYLSILEANISVVTPNKRANSGSYDYYRQLKTTARYKGVGFYYETNVGAGLPILSTILDLQLSGDKILKIESVLSGTLSYIFNNFLGERQFSEIVKTAQKEGYTEPDPREDLNGMDVARKILILARECGLPLELSDVVIEPILPIECYSSSSVPDFYRELDTYTEQLETKKKTAETEGQRLRYVATLHKGEAYVKLEAIGPDHPFYSLSGSDNIIAIYTERYRENPIVIKGPGAGAEVTAGGVFADMIRIGKR